MRSLTQQLIDKKIDFPTWMTTIRPELKVMHTGLAEIAIGGKSQWDLKQAGRLGARLRMLYDKLNGLGLEWENGTVSEAQLLARVDMAVQAGRGTFEGVIRGQMKDMGKTEEMRVLHSNNSCADCPPLSGYWAPIGSLPEIGSSACLSRCACTFDYR